MVLADVLSRKYEEVFFDDFYREIFGSGFLAPWDSDDPRADYPSGPRWYYTGLAMERLPETWPAKDGKEPRHKVVRHAIYDDLAAIHELVEDPKHKDNFIFLPPISYVGYRRLNKNARQIFALCIEIDDLVEKGGRQEGLRSLMLDIDQEYSPRPTFILCSGSGVHLYYVFEQPLNLYPSIFKRLEKMKKELTKRLWNRRITSSHEKIQYESICQPFRMLGTVTKSGERTRAFRIGGKCDIDYLNGFVKEKNQVFLHYAKYQRAEGVTPLAIAKEKWPDWYERVPARQKAGKKPIAQNSWKTNRAMYDRFLERIPYEARSGHRYNCLLVLGACAAKCQIPPEEYEEDCWRLLPELDFDRKKPFTEDDIFDVIKSYDSNLARMTVEAAAALSGITLRRDERRRRGADRIGQRAHLEIARAIQDVKCRQRGRDWREGNGRPKGSGTAQVAVLEWRKNHPDGRKADCIRDTGLTKPTVYKWWDTELDLSSSASESQVVEAESDWDDWIG